MSLRVLLSVLLLSAVFVVATSQELPSVVASHFALGGKANGFMSRGGYVAFMLIMMTGLVVIFEAATRTLRLFPARSFNLPNRDYWLAPERRDETLRNIERRGRWFGGVVIVFIAYVHYLVVRANAVEPPMLPEREFIIGLVCFVTAALVWAGVFIAYFWRAR